MPTVVLLAWSGPASAAHVDEFDTWYDEIHVPQISAVVGSVTAVNRYIFDDTDLDSDVKQTPGVPRYLTIYELSDTDVETANSALLNGYRQGLIDTTNSMDPTSARIEWYTRTA